MDDVVTVLVSDECADCKRVLNLFQKYKIPFQKINVDTHPRIMAVMIKRANCRTTPQVFFNQMHIGGAQAVTWLLMKYDQEAQTNPLVPTVYELISRDVYIDDIEFGSPVDDSHVDSQMFELTGEEISGAIIRSHQDEMDRKELSKFDCVQVTKEVKESIGKVSRDLLEWLTPAYKDYYSGNEVKDTLMKHYNFQSSNLAIAFGQELLNLGIIHRIGHDRLASNLFLRKGRYRLQSVRSPKILNSFRTWNERTGLYSLSLDPILTLSRLLRQMAEIIIASATNDTGIVDYYAARKNPKFRDFEEAVCELQLVNIKDIDDENAKKAFFINVYNLMENHAFVKFCPKKVKKGMFGRVEYVLGGVKGGFIFSMDEIYHGILRGNSEHPKSHEKLFSESDPRIHFSLQNIDERIHFALNSPNHSTLYEYHKDAINEELRIAAELYCNSNKILFISGKKNKGIFPKFMKIFVSDFATDGDTHSLLESVRKYLRMDTFRLRELNNMLEREKANDEEVTVLFKNNLSSPQKNMLRSIISSVKLSPNSPLRQVIRSLTPWAPDLTWDCKGWIEENTEHSLIRESSKSTLMTSSDGHSVSSNSIGGVPLNWI